MRDSEGGSILRKTVRGRHSPWRHTPERAGPRTSPLLAVLKRRLGHVLIPGLQAVPNVVADRNLKDVEAERVYRV